jgi:hypothetical protein
VDPTPDSTSCRPPEGYIAVRSRPKQHFGSATWDWDRLFPELATHLERFLAFAEQQAGWSDTPTGVVYAYEEDMSGDFVPDCRECGKDYAIVAIIYGETMLRHMNRTAFASVEYLSPEGAASVGFLTVSCGGPEVPWCNQHPEIVANYDDDCYTAWVSSPGGALDAGTTVYGAYSLALGPGGHPAECGIVTAISRQFILPGHTAELLAELDPFYNWFVVWPAIE